MMMMKAMDDETKAVMEKLVAEAKTIISTLPSPDPNLVEAMLSAETLLEKIASPSEARAILMLRHAMLHFLSIRGVTVPPGHRFELGMATINTVGQELSVTWNYVKNEQAPSTPIEPTPTKEVTP